MDMYTLVHRIVPGADQHLAVAPLALIIASLGLLKIWQFLLGVYRLHLHPLRHFPGLPEAGKSTKWLYKETIKGFPEHTFESLHELYDTKVLRISPNELHITEIELYKKIYNQSKPFLKEAAFYDSFNTPHTVFAELDPHLHKERRRMLNPLFSRVGIFKLEPIILNKVEILGSKINRLCKARTIDVYDAFRLLTTEIIMQFAFCRSPGMIEERPDDFRSRFLDALDATTNNFWTLQFSPWARRLSNCMPQTLLRSLSKELAELFNLFEFAEESLRYWQNHRGEASHPVVFDSLEDIPDPHKVTEAIDILIAGADTTASTLTTALMSILSSPSIHAKLVQALDTAMPFGNGCLPLKDLEKIDYLTACVKESLRIGMAVPGRLPRIVPQNKDDPFVVDGKVVPPGTVVSMTAYTMHTSVEAWGPDAKSFNPERWLMGDAKTLDKNFSTFSKGARMCIGQNLAPAEITIVLAYLFNKYTLGIPENFQPPPKADRFTLQYDGSGLPIEFELRTK